MARRPKRFSEGDEVEYSDYGSDKGRGAAGSSEIVTAPESTRGAAGSSETVKPKAVPTPKAEPTSEPSSIRRLSREEGEAIRQGEAIRKASEASKSAPAKTESTATPVSAKKEYYRDVSGKMQVKTSQADRDAESAARRAKVVEAAKSVGSGIGSLFNKAIENYKSTVPRYNKEKKMAKGGTASSRADGIAQRGKTRGTIASMCGGGMAKGKR